MLNASPLLTTPQKHRGGDLEWKWEMGVCWTKETGRGVKAGKKRGQVDIYLLPFACCITSSEQLENSRLAIEIGLGFACG